ncbi:hypothetical protein HDV01_004330 [Terramyces sp. JEL0728]|nr:hypothetical protein HDV01_004330 [Terramyces sp. JEL0728]
MTNKEQEIAIDLDEDNYDGEMIIEEAVEGWIVLVTSVHEELTEEDLIEKFAEYGPIKNIHMNLDRRTGYVKGYALIEYNEYEEAKNAISNLDGTDLQGKILKCDFAFVRGSHASRSSQQISKRREKRQ